MVIFSLCDRKNKTKQTKKPTDLCALFHNIQSNLCAQLNDLQRAVPCAHTFLQRNPEDQQMQQLMEEYKSKYDLSGYLIDHEERPYEVRSAQPLFLKSGKASPAIS